MAITMTTSKMTEKQINRAIEIFRAQLVKHAPEFPSDAVQLAFGHPGFASDLLGAFRKRVEATMFLAPRGTETVILTERHDPDTFYRTCEGLYVWDDFRSRIVANAKPSELGRTMKVNCAELMRDLTDKEIELALPIDHLFDETEVCAVIAGLIASQPNGEEGALLNTGYANLFYTSSCVVYVYWYADYRGWHVNAWKRGDYGWGAGYQVFSPAN